jgi:NAD(P)-dependent dehydrogenase (short-subunit alcohol dehydrogenase family)
MFEYTAPENCLKGKKILVTGSAAGIGRAAAIAYAKHGATVLLHGRKEKTLNPVYDEIVNAGYEEPAICPLDLEFAQPEQYEELAALVEQEFGTLDGLLNNASILGVRSPIQSYDPSVWMKVMHVNANAAFMMTQAMLPLMQHEGPASIAFTSSSVGRKGRAHWGAYAVSKFATEGLMETLADELPGMSNIRVNSINPGATKTQMRAWAYPGENPNDNPSPSEILNLYLYLMSDDSIGVNGQKLNAQ